MEAFSNNLKILKLDVDVQEGSTDPQSAEVRVNLKPQGDAKNEPVNNVLELLRKSTAGFGGVGDDGENCGAASTARKIVDVELEPVFFDADRCW